MIAGFPVASAAVASEPLYGAGNIICGEVTGADRSLFVACGASDLSGVVAGDVLAPSSVRAAFGSTAELTASLASPSVVADGNDSPFGACGDSESLAAIGETYSAPGVVSGDDDSTADACGTSNSPAAVAAMSASTSIVSGNDGRC